MSGTLITVTDAGRAALVAPGNDGTNAHQLVEIGLATAPFVADKEMTELPHEYKRVTTFAGTNVADDTLHVTIKDDSADQFTLYGFGLYLEDGTLVALYGQRMPIMEKSPDALLLLSADLQFASIDAATLVFGDASFANPPATTELQGVVELATNEETIAGTDASRAVTPVGLQSALAPALAKKADAHHTHVVANVMGLQSALDAKFDKDGGRIRGRVLAPELDVVGAKGHMRFAVNDSVGMCELQSCDGSGDWKATPIAYAIDGSEVRVGTKLRADAPVGFQATDGGGGAESNYVGPGNGDSASQHANNIQLRSWYGIGFGPSISGQTVPSSEYSHWFDTRTGNSGMRGRLTVGGAYVLLDSANGNGQQRCVHHNDGTVGFVGSGGAWAARFQDDGNFWTPAFGWMNDALNARVPVRTGHAGHGYVLNDSPHQVNVQWQGGHLNAYVDGQWQGWLVTHTSGSNFFAPRSVVDVNGVGSYRIFRRGHPNIGDAFTDPGAPGVWMSMGQYSSGGDVFVLACRHS
jgi:hypothetical protein